MWNTVAGEFVDKIRHKNAAASLQCFNSERGPWWLRRRLPSRTRSVNSSGASRSNLFHLCFSHVHDRSILYGLAKSQEFGQHWMVTNGLVLRKSDLLSLDSFAFNLLPL